MKHKPYIKSDKLNRIYTIVWGDTDQTPEEFKETINMFRGRQMTKANMQECFEYLKLSLLKQEGDKEAADQLTEIHKSWNPRHETYQY